jgi:hypothetical protein
MLKNKKSRLVPVKYLWRNGFPERVFGKKIESRTKTQAIIAEMRRYRVIVTLLFDNTSEFIYFCTYR